METRRTQSRPASGRHCTSLLASFLLAIVIIVVQLIDLAECLPTAKSKTKGRLEYEEPDAVPVGKGGVVTPQWRNWITSLKQVFPNFAGPIGDTFTRIFQSFFGGGGGGGLGGVFDFSTIVEFKRQLISSLMGITRGGLRKGAIRQKSNRTTSRKSAGLKSA